MDDDKRCEETKAVIQRYKERLTNSFGPTRTLTGLHVDVVPGADPGELERELSKIQDLFDVRAKIDPLTLAQAKIERYEVLLSKISALGKTNIKDLATQSSEVFELKNQINILTSMFTAENISHDIEFATKHGRLLPEQYYGCEKDA